MTEAAFYDEAVAKAEAWNGPLKAVYSEIRRWIPKTSACVDLGCGTGPLLGALLERGGIASYVGIDFSRRSLGFAQKMYPRALFVEDDLRTVDLDAVVRSNGPKVVFAAVETLEHLEDDVGLVRRIPGGCSLVGTVPNYPSPGHARTFGNVSTIFERYGELLELRRWFAARVGPEATALIHCFEGVRRSDVW